MEIDEARIAADRGWRLHIARSVLLVAASVVSLTMWHKLEMARWFLITIWGSGGLLHAEWTWNEWRQRQILRSLQAPLGVEQFRLLRARERLHNTIRLAVFIVPWTGWMFWMERKFAYPALFNLILMMQAVICIWKVRKAADELRQA